MPTKYEKQLAAAAKRRAEVVRLKSLKRYTYQEIGRMMKPPISAQRVRQILVQEGVVS